MNEAKIRKVILRLLSAAHPRALPEKTLFHYVNDDVRPPLTQNQFDDHVLFLQDGDYIKALPGELGETQPRWRITEAGLGEIA